jgi:hypothetical protein
VTGPLSFAPAPDLGTALPRLNGEPGDDGCHLTTVGRPVAASTSGFRRVECICGCGRWWAWDEDLNGPAPLISGLDSCLQRLRFSGRRGGRKPSPFAALCEAALSLAGAEAEDDFTRAQGRLRAAAIRYVAGIRPHSYRGNYRPRGIAV